jgi:TPR repeat protein
MQIKPLSASLRVLTVLAICCAQPSNAQLLDLKFAPPQMETPPVCIPRRSDHDLTAYWQNWNGKFPAGMPVGLITRELRRLAELDAPAWDSVLQRAFLALAASDHKYTGDDLALAQIGQMIASGRLQDLNQSGLVQKLLLRVPKTSARTQFILAGLLASGTGIAKDPARAAALLLDAGYNGSADALLALSAQSLAGPTPQGWSIAPNLAIPMAFGALIGELDPLICDRIARIARAYTGGDMLVFDHALALQWYQFAADLGDPLSAWRVAEYHLQSELIVKDNAVLMRYLQKAADGGLPYAQIALGRIYEAGALAPQDIDAAQALYVRAAQNDDLASLVRLAGFYEHYMPAQPALRADFAATLARLAEQPQPPAWVFAKQAQLQSEDQGAWSDGVQALWQRAAAGGDTTAQRMVAQMNLGRAQTEAQFYTALDPMIDLVANQGEAYLAGIIKEAFLCKSPSGNHADELALWNQIEAAMGTSAIAFTPAAVADFALGSDPRGFAGLQTQALMGRGQPLAQMIALLQGASAPPETLAFWTGYGAEFSPINTDLGTIALARALTPAAREAALLLFAKGMEAGEAGAALKLAAALLQMPNLANRARALDLLRPLAATGVGEAMHLLLIADPLTYPNLQTVYGKYASAIAQRGDFAALLIAMPFLPNASLVETYRARASAVMTCSFPEAIAFADVWHALGQPARVTHWLDIAAVLLGGDGGKMVTLGDAQRSYWGDQAEASARALYQSAADQGNKTAVQRQIKIFADPALAGYDVAKAAGLYVQLISLEDPAAIPEILAGLTRRNPALAVIVDTKLDLGEIYRAAAEAGNPAAMREHAQRLRSTAQTASQSSAATDWLIRAADSGDAKAMALLSQAYSLGIGIAQSPELAEAWLQRAADAGDAAAKALVDVLSAQGVLE